MTPLRPFQLEGVRQIYQFRGRALLADEQGLGKTIQSLYWILKTPSRRPVVIVCPASVKYNWQAEALLHFDMRIDVIEGHRRKRHFPELGHIVVINYDILKSWLPVFLKKPPQTLILDEIHFIKDPAAKRAKAVLQLAAMAKSVIGLSGTPLKNRPIELWTALQAIRPDLFPDRNKFAWRYCRPRYHPRFGWMFDGHCNTKELHSILRRECMIRRLKKDVLPELPDKVHRVVSFRLKSYNEYNRAQNDFINWLKKKSPHRAKKAGKAESLTKVGYLLRLVARLKLEATARWISEFMEAHPGEKMVCLTMHTFVIDYLRERFKHRSLIIDGRVTGRKREDTVVQFRSNKRYDLLFGNWIAAGVGLNLQVARYVVGLDFPWTPGDLLQGEDRVHRIGQKKDVMAFYLVVLQTIEEKLIKLLRTKSKVLNQILNGDRPVEDLNIFDLLLEEMKRAK